MYLFMEHTAKFSMELSNSEMVVKERLERYESVVP